MRQSKDTPFLGKNRFLPSSQKIRLPQQLVGAAKHFYWMYIVRCSQLQNFQATASNHVQMKSVESASARQCIGSRPTP